MKNVSKYFWLMFGLVLVGAGCASSDEVSIESGLADEIQVVEVTVEGDGEGVVIVEDEDDLSAPAGDRGASDIEDALKGEEDTPVGGDPVVDTNFTMTSGNFFFEPSSLRVNAGDTVNLFFSENSGTHDFTIDEIGFSQSISSNGIVSFTAPTTPGSYAYYCSIGSHRALGMEGVLIVE